MHEMAILSNVMDVVLDYAKKNQASKVVSVSLVVGELRDTVDDLMESCFRFLARDTIASTAHLNLKKVPLKAQCSECLLVFGADIKDPETLQCPDCGNTKLSIKTGKEFLIDSIEIV